MTFGILDFPHSISTNDFVYAIQNMLEEQLVVCKHSLPDNPSFQVLFLADDVTNFEQIKTSVHDFLRAGGKVVGIGNGVASLINWKLLPGVLEDNVIGRSLTQEVVVEVADETSFITEELEVETELLFTVSGEKRKWNVEEAYQQLFESGRILFRYIDKADGFVNVKEASQQIAGLQNETGNVAGLLFHPERAVDDEIGNTDGRGVFLSLVSTTTKPVVVR